MKKSKKSRKLLWLLAGFLIFVGILVAFGDSMLGGGGQNIRTIFFLCFGGGVLLAFLLTIDWVMEVRKESSSFEKKGDSRPKELACSTGLHLLQERELARTEEERGNWNLKWGVHKKECPFCKRI